MTQADEKPIRRQFRILTVKIMVNFVAFFLFAAGDGDDEDRVG